MGFKRSFPGVGFCLLVGAATWLALGFLFSSRMTALAGGSTAGQSAEQQVDDGRKVFRFDTFGSEAFLGKSLELHQAIAGVEHGGVGPGLSPARALSLGLKLDAQAVPPSLRSRLAAGELDREDSATTIDLLEARAIVGLTGFFTEDRQLVSIGFQCALCHATVDDSLAPGIGRRLDGWANRDLDLGAFLALAPGIRAIATRLEASDAEARRELERWGPGKVDVDLLGGAERAGSASPRLIPPTFGAAALIPHAWRGLDATDERVEALHSFQLELRAPSAPAECFDPLGAVLGRELFEGKADCRRCHVQDSDAALGTSSDGEAKIPDRRPPSLQGLWTHLRGGFFHDGRFATLQDVVERHPALTGPELTDEENMDLVEYLKSL